MSDDGGSWHQPRLGVPERRWGWVAQPALPHVFVDKSLREEEDPHDDHDHHCDDADDQGGERNGAGTRLLIPPCHAKGDAAEDDAGNQPHKRQQGGYAKKHEDQSYDHEITISAHTMPKARLMATPKPPTTAPHTATLMDVGTRGPFPAPDGQESVKFLAHLTGAFYP